MPTPYDIIEAIEAEGVTLTAAHNSDKGWQIKADGRLGDNHRLLIGAYRSDIVHLLGVRQLAAARHKVANTANGGPKKRGALRDYYTSYMTGDKLRAFEAGWNNEETKA